VSLWASWRSEYLADAVGDLRVAALMKSAAAYFSGQAATIRALRLLPADRAGSDPNDADMRVAAALAGLAMGLGGVDPVAGVGS
jgi:hypothetical protein